MIDKYTTMVYNIHKGGESMRLNISMKLIFYKKLKEKANLAGMNISEYMRYALICLWGDDDVK